MAIVRMIRVVFLGTALAIASVGCAPKPATPPTSPPIAETASNPARPASASLAVGDDIAKACSISVANVERAPKFDFDQSSLSKEDRDVLVQIAKCLTIGPLKGRALKLVGRADSRGEAEYNMGLGGHRAQSVKGYLTQLGVEDQKIAETSRGKLDATGINDEGYRRDRRVDVLLQ
jgi:peptidoglycan-associated lipoprotein